MLTNLEVLTPSEVLVSRQCVQTPGQGGDCIYLLPIIGDVSDGYNPLSGGLLCREGNNLQKRITFYRVTLNEIILYEGKRM